MRIEEIGVGRKDVIQLLKHYCPQFEKVTEHDEGANKRVLRAEMGGDSVAIAYGLFVEPDKYRTEAVMTQSLADEVPHYFPAYINYLEIDPERGVVVDSNAQQNADKIDEIDESRPALSFIVMDFLEDFLHVDRFVENHPSGFTKDELKNQIAGIVGYATGYVLGRTGMYTGDPNSGNILLNSMRTASLTREAEVYEDNGVPQSVSLGRIKLKFVDCDHFVTIKPPEVLELMVGKGCRTVEDVFTNQAFKRIELRDGFDNIHEENLNTWRMNLVSGYDHGANRIRPIK